MRRVVLWLASTVTIVVLLFGYHTSTDTTSAGSGSNSASTEPSTSPTTSSPASPSFPSSSGSSSSGSSSSSSGSSSSHSSAAKTYTGSAVQTRWGPVQVQITVQNGTVTKATVLQQPNGNPKDTEINDYALPILIQDTLQAQSTRIDMVSGATVTSTGYVQSLQAALDAAGI